MNSWINFSALWKIVTVGLLAGAGLPAVFALGIRELALPGTRPGPESTGRLAGGSTVGLVVAGACFAVVLAGIALGIYVIVAA